MDLNAWADSVYKEIFPTFEQVQMEVVNNPNTPKPKHLLSERKCPVHNVNFRVYVGMQKTGKVYRQHVCPMCKSEQIRERWKNKIKQALA